MGQDRESRLVGWKRIAAHLGCSERTARRWEREEQLPVHRQPHEKRSTVYALPSELDGWIARRSEHPVEPTNNHGSPGPSRGPVRPIALILALLTFGGGALFVYSRQPAADRDTGERPGADQMALDLYNQGRALWRQRGEVPNARAIRLLTEAVERDADFAEAWAALASAWLTYPTYSDDVSLERAVDEALLAADRAVQLDPGLVEPRSVMAAIAQRRGDWLTSERIYRDALDVDPENTSLLLWFAGHYRELGMMQNAERLNKAALKREPNSPPVLTEIAMNDNSMGRLEASLRKLHYLWFDLGFETPVIWVGRWIGMVEQGDYAGALAWIEETAFPDFAPVLTRYVEFQQNSADQRSVALSAEVTAAYQAGLPAWLAYHMLDQSGDPSAALDILEQESAEGLFDTSVVLFYPRGGSARSTTRFADLIGQLGFYEYWREHGSPDICRQERSPFCLRLEM